MEREGRDEKQPGSADIRVLKGVDIKNRDLPEWYVRSHNVIMYVLGVIEVLLGLRLLFKLLGANPANGFVSFLYSLTSVFIIPFRGIFRTVASSGAAAKFVFEPATVIAMIIYAIAAYGLVKLIRLRLPA
jgi:hypothetical protein